MAKKPVKRITIVSRGATLFKVVYKQLTEYEAIVKFHGEVDPSVHLSLVMRAMGFEPHITDEKASDRSKTHRFYRLLTREEFLNSYLILFSTPGCRPPRITSVDNEEEMKKVNLWIKASASRFIHPPKHRRIMVFKDGPLKEVITRLLNQGNPDAFTFDVEEFINYEDKRLGENEKFEWKFEDEVRPEALEMGFLKRPDRSVIISCSGVVIEFDNDAFHKWYRSLEKLPGLEEYFDELKARGALTRKRP